ncbi:MAG: hypothetical protein ACJAV2_002779 [Myxococcota bacterium]|jgi:hypothetical protein
MEPTEDVRVALDMGSDSIESDLCGRLVGIAEAGRGGDREEAERVIAYDLTGPCIIGGPWGEYGCRLYVHENSTREYRQDGIAGSCCVAGLAGCTRMECLAGAAVELRGRGTWYGLANRIG